MTLPYSVQQMPPNMPFVTAAGVVYVRTDSGTDDIIAVRVVSTSTSTSNERIDWTRAGEYLVLPGRTRCLPVEDAELLPVHPRWFPAPIGAREPIGNIAVGCRFAFAGRVGEVLGARAEDGWITVRWSDGSLGELFPERKVEVLA